MRIWERVVFLLGFVTLAVMGMWYTGYAISGSERRQCEIINAEVAVMKEAPPSTETGRVRLRVYEEMKLERGC